MFKYKTNIFERIISTILNIGSLLIYYFLSKLKKFTIITIISAIC